MTTRDTVISMKETSSAAVRAIVLLNAARRKGKPIPSVLKDRSSIVRFQAVSVRRKEKPRLLLRISSAAS